MRVFLAIFFLSCSSIGMNIDHENSKVIENNNNQSSKNKIEIKVFFNGEQHGIFSFERCQFKNIEYFDNLLNGNFAEKNKTCIELNIHPSAFECIINYILFKKIDTIDFANFFYLVDKIDEYGLTDMKDELLLIISDKIKKEEFNSIDDLINLLSYSKKFKLFDQIKDTILNGIANYVKYNNASCKSLRNQLNLNNDGVYYQQLNEIYKNFCEPFSWQKDIKEHIDFETKKRKQEEKQKQKQHHMIAEQDSNKIMDTIKDRLNFLWFNVSKEEFKKCITDGDCFSNVCAYKSGKFTSKSNDSFSMLNETFVLLQNKIAKHGYKITYIFKKNPILTRASFAWAHFSKETKEQKKERIKRTAKDYAFLIDKKLKETWENNKYSFYMPAYDLELLIKQSFDGAISSTTGLLSGPKLCSTSPHCDELALTLNKTLAILSKYFKIKLKNMQKEHKSPLYEVIFTFE